MQTTDNYELNLYEGTDKFNPLLVENVNSEKIDEVLGYLNSRVVDTATEIKNGSVHAITRANGESATFRFTATANWTSGDTITVDGIQVSAFLTSGEALGTNAYVIGTEVLCNLVGTRLTVYCVSGTVTEADNALKLGGQLPSYYGTAEAVTSANALATAANQISIANQGKISQLNSDLNTKLGKPTSLWTSSESSLGAFTVNLKVSNYSFIAIRYHVHGSTSWYKTFIHMNNDFGDDSVTSNNIGGTVSRSCDMYSDKINFSQGYANGGINNAMMVPIAIYGIK